MSSSNQAAARRCEHCGAPLTSGARGGLCVRCALGNALISADARDSLAGARAAAQQELAHDAELFPRTFGGYELLEELGRGGMGVVYKARQKSLGRTVALKMILAGQFANKEFVTRFRAEASAAAVLQHPNIVAIHEVGMQEGQHYFSMDYVRGRTLAEVVREGPLSGRPAAGYVKTIAEAIHYAHEQGILHRDLKPANVIIDENGQPHITDFGLAKRLTESQASTLNPQLTLSGQLIGSPNYMAPEQAAGRHHRVSRRTDVYALGAMFYHLLTGRPPFVSEAISETLRQVLEAEAASPRLLNASVPHDLETVCLKCLEKEPGRRYQTAQELADELGRFLGHEPILARPVSVPEKLWRWCRRKPVIATLSLTTLVLILAVVIGSPVALFQINRNRQRAERNAGDLRLSLYAAQMNQAFRAWDVGNLDVARALLNAPRSQTGEADLRSVDWRWLWSLCQSEAKAVLPTRGEWQILAAEPSPDGRRVATAGSSTNIVIYDLADETDPQILRGHTRNLMGFHSLAFSPDGQYLVSGSGGLLESGGKFELLLWDLATWSKTKLEERPASFLAVAFSPNGRWIASACLDGTVGLWDVLTRRNLAPLRGHPGQVYSVVFSPDSRTLFTGSEDGTVRQWDVTLHREIRPPIEHTEPVGNLAISPDGRTLAMECGDNYLHLYDLASGKSQKLRYALAERCPGAPAFSPDGRLLAFSTGNNIRIWDLEARQERTILRGSTGNIVSLRFLPDGRHLVSACEFGRPLLWDIDRPEKLSTLRGFSQGVRSMAVSSDSRRLVVGSGDFLDPARPSEVIVFDLVSQQRLFPPLQHPHAVDSISLPTDGKLLATECADGSVRVFTLPEGRLLRTLTNASSRSTLVFSPDGRTLVAYGGDTNPITAWNTASWEAKSLLDQPPGGPLNFAFSPDGSLLATPMGVAMFTIIWSMPAGTTNRVIPYNDHARGAAFSADGTTLAVYGFKNIELYQVGTWAHLGTLEGHEHVINGIAFAPDGKTLASVGIEGALRLWSVPGGEEVAVLYDHLNSVNDVVFTPDGQWLISGSRDKTVKLRRIPSFAEIHATEQRDRAAEAKRDWAMRAGNRAQRAQQQARRAGDAGAIKQWLVLLPIAIKNTGGHALREHQVRQESQLRPRAGERIKVGRHELVWRAVRLEDYVLDFNDLAGELRESSVAYAVAYLDSEAAQKGVLLKVGSDDQARVYLNGKLIYQCVSARSYTPDQDTVAGLELNPGINVVVFKVVNQVREWEGSLWFTDAAGQPLKGINVTLAPP